MDAKHVLVEASGGVAVLVISRPEALNALNAELLAELSKALDRVEKDRSVGAVVITGAGKAFVAGADIKAMAGLSGAEALAFSRNGQAILSRIEAFAKPVIAAVNGFALGGGFELALACDFIYAATSAKFGLPETTLGLIPGFGGTRRLARLAGPNIARELILTGRYIDAATAYHYGIVNEVLTPEELLPLARERAALVAAAGPRAVRAAREALNFGLDASLPDSLAHESALFALLFSGTDAREGMAAFIDKRHPHFSGD